MVKGWYFVIGKKEFFCETKRQNKTTGLCEGILKSLNQPVTEGNIEYLKTKLLKANLEVKWCPDVPDMGIKGHYYYNIWGKNFSGYGSDDVDDGKTIVFRIEGEKIC